MQGVGWKIRGIGVCVWSVECEGGGVGWSGVEDGVEDGGEGE